MFHQRKNVVIFFDCYDFFHKNLGNLIFQIISTSKQNFTQFIKTLSDGVHLIIQETTEIKNILKNNVYLVFYMMKLVVFHAKVRGKILEYPLYQKPW